ncbi:MAG: cupredoxin domain-containing protein [Nitrososphaerales archaeon]
MAASAKPKSLSATGPVLIVIVIIIAAILGYYQIVYYPSAAPTSTTLSVVPPTLHNATVAIPVGAATKPTPQSFSPDTIVVIVGYNSTVFWVNNDTTEHTITSSGNSPDQRFDIFGPQNPQNWNVIQGKGTPGSTLNFTFTVPGNYSYYCSFHANMKGTVIVKPATSATVSASQMIEPSHGVPFERLGSLFLGAYTGFIADALFANSLATLTGSGTDP